MGLSIDGSNTLSKQETDMDKMLEELLLMLLSETDEARELERRFTDRRRLFRALMNIRMPAPYPCGYLELQDAYLSREAEIRGVISWREIPTIKESLGVNFKNSDKLSLWKGDITNLSVDAIVNAANTQMLGCFAPCHSCIDNAIHSASGLQLRDECHEYMISKGDGKSVYLEPTGSAFVTKGYNLPAHYVIHTVGPIVSGVLREKHIVDLRSSYESCLNKSLENGIRSIAFCCISTGVFGFPKEEAASVAVKTVSEFLEIHGDEMDRVIFNVFGDVDLSIYNKLLKSID